MMQNFLNDLVACKAIRRYEWLETIPTVQEGEFLGADDIGDHTYVLCWKGVSSEAAERYLMMLREAKFTVYAENRIGENHYTGWHGTEADLYVSYTPANNMLRVYAEEKGTSVPPHAPAEAYQTVPGYCPTFWQLPVDWKGSKQNGGMSYVIRVADGRFVIIDGGYPTEQEGEVLYRFLMTHRLTEEKPVIAAWFITHPHGDHFGAMQAMSRKHAEDITVQAFYYNFPVTGKGYALSPIPQWMRTDMSKFDGAARYDKVHTGTTVWVADARFDILFTQEDLYPCVTANQNDTSLVIRMTFGGQRVMFLADIMEPASKALMACMPKEELKSDIVQFSHHGYEGATQEVYDSIAAPTVLWPMNIYGWQRPDKSNVFERWKKVTGTRLQQMPNDYICQTADYVKKIILNGEGVTEFSLPYQPTGDKLPDYVAIHDAIAAVEEPAEG